MIRTMNLSNLIVALILIFEMGGICAAQVAGGESAGPRSYSCSGVIERVVPNQSQVIIHHKEIPNFMPEMTMAFNVKDTNELKGLLPGQEVHFGLRVLPENAWVENIAVVGYSKEPIASQPLEGGSRLRIGEKWPDGELRAEDGRVLHFSDFRGQTLAFNFFFSRCPLPNYCPLLNRNFAKAQQLLSSESGGQARYAFLSVSFDLEYDTPERLAEYARNYREEGSQGWLFATAAPRTMSKLPPGLGLMVKRQGSSITHNLRTVVLDPQGRVYRQFDGNNWTAQELASAMKEAGQHKNIGGSP